MEKLLPKMQDTEFELWRDLIGKRCGLYLADNRRSFLQQRLWERMTLQQVANYREYYGLVAARPAGPQDQPEWAALLETLLNQESSFFRHRPSYEALISHLLPDLANRVQPVGSGAGRLISLWSAGCSIGQEPYSLAMAAQEWLSSLAKTSRANWQVKISASDISWRALEKARLGRYNDLELRRLPEAYRLKYLTSEAGGQHSQIKEAIRAMVHFSYLNLSEPGSYRMAYQDIIFCQNVLIYFTPQVRTEIVRRLCERLNLGGYLVLAPAEMVGLRLAGIQPVRLPGTLIYQRETQPIQGRFLWQA